MIIELPELAELTERIKAVQAAITEADEVLNAPQASKLLKIGVNEIRAMAADGRLPAAYFGNGWRFSRRLLLEWVREQCQGNTSVEATR